MFLYPTQLLRTHVYWQHQYNILNLENFAKGFYEIWGGYNSWEIFFIRTVFCINATPYCFLQQPHIEISVYMVHADTRDESINTHRVTKSAYTTFICQQVSVTDMCTRQQLLSSLGQFHWGPCSLQTNRYWHHLCVAWHIEFIYVLSYITISFSKVASRTQRQWTHLEE